ncbi:MAG TPA: hypothetical protein VGP06_11860 [Janthinobacterium sp.]|jgi:hypothetical protein|nr:hypothetical protein [Janthinobacterium sp.]
MMHPSDMKLVAAAGLTVAVFCALRPGIARAEQRIVCPVSTLPLEAAAPILGPVEGPLPGMKKR